MHVNERVVYHTDLVSGCLCAALGMRLRHIGCLITLKLTRFFSGSSPSKPECSYVWPPPKHRTPHWMEQTYRRYERRKLSLTR